MRLQSQLFSFAGFAILRKNLKIVQLKILKSRLKALDD
jgi:hypothetical protein